MKDEPKPVTEEFAQELESLGDDVLDFDNEYVTKPRFKINYAESKSTAPKRIASVKTLGNKGTLPAATKSKPLGAGGIKKRQGNP